MAGTLGTVSVRIACCQFPPDVEAPDASAALAREAIAGAVANGAQIVVLPELCTSGYVFREPAEARAAATAPDGDLLRGWAAEAARGDALVVGGFCELAPDGRLFNSSALVDGNGVDWMMWRCVFQNATIAERSISIPSTISLALRQFSAHRLKTSAGLTIGE